MSSAQISGMETHEFTVELKRLERYQFTAQFDQPADATLLLDEPPPLGEGKGPNPSRLLAAAVGDCLSASLLFCLSKARIDVSDVTATVHGTMVRNESGRLRISGLRVQLEPVIAAADRDRSRRCREIFEDFCIVTESVRHGIAVDVELRMPEPAEAS